MQLRVEFEGFFLVRLGVFPVALFGVGQAPVVVGQGEVWIESDRLGVVTNGRIEGIQTEVALPRLK